MILDLVIVLLSSILLAIAVYSPPLMLAIYSIFSNIADGFAIGYLIRTLTSQLYTAFMSILLLIAVIVSYYRLYNNKSKILYGKRFFLLGSIVLACTLWMGLQVILKNGNILSVPNTMTNFGIPCMIIVLAYYKFQFAKYLFFTCLFLQLVLAFCIVIFPDSSLSSLSAVNYEASEIKDFSLFSQTYNFGIARLSDQDRLFAHFYNPNGYGFYAIIGIIVGCYVMLSNKYCKFERFFGILLTIFSLFGWSVTFSRGTTFGLLLGAFFAYIVSLTRKVKKIKFLLILLVLLTFLFILFVIPIISRQYWRDIILLAENDVDIGLRIDAISQGLEVFIDNPIIGAPLNFNWNDDIPPHQIMIYSAVVYGAFIGFNVTVIFILVALGNIFNNKMPKKERCLIIVISSATICTGLTNNFAVPILFWVCVAISCIPWCLQPKYLFKESKTISSIIYEDKDILVANKCKVRSS